MANLAIKGHPTRGREVIQLLEMLGGVNKYSAQGNCPEKLYFICDNKGIKYLMKSDERTDLMEVYTLKEFEEKFPYKVGDKVYNIIHNENQTITEVAWDFQENVVVYQTNNNEYLFVNYLQPYKKQESVASNTEIGKGAEYENIKVSYLSINDKEYADEIEINLGDDYEYKFEMNRLYILKKKSKYPKDYEECEYSGLSSNPVIVALAQGVVMGSFAKLFTVRNEYWRIYGEQMGLGKPWEPDYTNIDKLKYCIINNGIHIELFDSYTPTNKILIFPTAEMRNEFYDNFKDLIEQCKEVL